MMISGKLHMTKLRTSTSIICAMIFICDVAYSRNPENKIEIAVEVSKFLDFSFL